MARRVSRSAMGLQVHPSIINKRIPIQPSLRRKRHDTGWNWRTHPASRTIWPNPQPLKHGHSSRSLTRTQRKSPHMQFSCQTKSCQKVQRKPMSTIIRNRGLSMENGQQCKKEGWQILRQLGRPIPYTWRRRRRSLSPWTLIWGRNTQHLECVPPQILFS